MFQVCKILSLVIMPHSTKLEEHEENKIKTFITDASIRRLFFYVESNTLKIEFAIRQIRTNAMFCIKRDSLCEITRNNFWSGLIFGNVDQNFEEALILVLKLIYAFLFYSSSSLPYSMSSEKYSSTEKFSHQFLFYMYKQIISGIRIQVTKNLEEFLCILTEKYYQSFGLTAIYTPAITLENKDGFISRIKLDDILSLFESKLDKRDWPYS